MTTFEEANANHLSAAQAMLNAAMRKPRERGRAGNTGQGVGLAGASPRRHCPSRGREAMSTNHTPGPWLREGQLIYALHSDGPYKGFNRFSTLVDACLGQGGTKAEADADAALIAASPDLLEAAKAAQLVLHGFHCGANAPLAWGGGCAVECTLLRAAIALAEGVTP